MSTVQVSFRLKFATRHDVEANVHVGYCPSLRLYSQGRTDQEAEAAVVSAATMFIVACYGRDILHTALRKRGMRKATAGIAALKANEQSEFIAVRPFDREFWREVPISLLADQEAIACQQ
jgi:hypothetical protein